VREDVEINVIMRYFLTNFLLFFLGLIQYSLRNFISWKVPTDIEEFTHLIPVANISIMILNVNGPQHGYYIHGQNPNGTSEGTAADLKRFL